MAESFLVLCRHRPTLWNLQKRLQGRIDIPLSSESLIELQTLRAPPEYWEGDLFASPLARARETAVHLWQREPVIEERLIELSYGDWEGLTKEEIQKQNFNYPEWPALDLAPPNGESVAKAIERIKPWLIERAQAQRTTLAVTHKGLMLAIYALATGWAGHEKPKPRMREGLQIFKISKTGQLKLFELNVPYSMVAPQSGK
jgi:broad specificity phosphatase PhoE